jgi:hypothetical protein
MISTTYIAGIVSFLVFVLPVLGFDVIDQGTLTATVTQVAGVAAVLYSFYGRYRAGGISAFGFRKTSE